MQPIICCVGVLGKDILKLKGNYIELCTKNYINK